MLNVLYNPYSVVTTYMLPVEQGGPQWKRRKTLGKTVLDKTESDIATMLKDEYGIHQIPIVSRMFGFVVNSFFVEKPYPTLVDVPPDQRGYLNKLQFGLGKVGYSINDVRRIIVTHPHFDHFGAARTIAETSGADIWVSEGGARWLEDFQGEIRSEEMVRDALLFESGAKDTEVQDVDEYYRRAAPLARSIKPTRRLKEGDSFELASLVFMVTTVPGHTPWCILLHDVEYKMGFSGDFLQTVTSNPIIQRNTKIMQSYNSLKSYIVSLEKIRATGLRLALPGHGAIIQDGSKKAQQILQVINGRRNMILRLLKQPNQTPVEISHRLFPDLLPGRLFNAVSEVMAHLEILEEDGLIHRVGNHPTHFSLS
jgi:glyoxylase-like metal-dependent hydrolase (beta-lactamase superfamily II)